MNTSNRELPIKSLALYLSIALYFFSLSQNCYCAKGNCAESLFVLIGGIFGFMAGGAALTWLANPILWFSWIMCRNLKVSLIASTASSVISISFLFFREVIVDEAGHLDQIISYESGYYLWLLSSLIMTAGNVYSYITTMKRQATIVEV
ncbi:MAG: hypothetical protein JWQ25_113 [Daejeonella sp.]|nr:hypothetical protein [Daejeonella sp.]